MRSDDNKLRDKLFAILRDRIVRLEYPPDKILTEQELCREFRVSRTPVREVIRKLEEINLVKALPRYGTRVSPIDIEEFRSALEVKIKLEPLTGALAARRISAEELGELEKLVAQASEQPKGSAYQEMLEIEARFHQIIYQATHNRVLEEVLTNINMRCARLFYSTLGQAIGVGEVVAQMRAIFEATRDKDEERAARLLEAHTQYFIDQLKDKLF